MMRSLVLAALVAACSSPAHSSDAVGSATPARTPPRDAANLADAAVDAGVLHDAGVPHDAGVLVDAAPAKKLGKHGAVCRWNVPHQRAGGGPAPVECGPGLHCCYPCGIQGCDFTCMTQAECNVNRP